MRVSEQIETVVTAPSEDRTLPAVVYALYLVGLANGLTILIGLVIAYANREAASPMARSHYTFLIRTFWLSIAWFLIGCALIGVGAVFSIILVGIPLVILGGLICSVVGIWFAVRAIVGVITLSRGEAYPRPDTWLV
jgi:uncharacterized membrane protein